MKVKFLLKSNEVDSDAEAGFESGSEDDTAYATDILKLHHQQKRGRVSKYKSTKHLTSTVCNCERLFSRTKIIMRPHRASMQPWHLELLVFLRANKSLWDVNTIEELTKRNFEKTGEGHDVMTMNPILTSKCNDYAFL